MPKTVSIALLGFALLAAPLHAETAEPRDRPTVALVLSGGGARGGAHIGVLKKFEEAGVPIDMISGASFGALVGGLYAVGYSASDIELIVQEIDWDQLFDDTPDRRLLNFDNKRRADRRLFELQFEQLDLKLPTGLQPGQKIRQLLDRLTALPVMEAGNDFDRLPVAFRAVATDILNGLPHVFKNGSMSEAIRASIAVPGLFTPLELGDALLMDGGLADNLPVDAALDAGADLVIAVDVSTPLKSRKEQIGSLLDILDQVISIHIEENKQESLQKAHVVVIPELDPFSSSDFAQVSQVMERGYRAAEEALPTLRQLFTEHGVALGSFAPRRPLLAAESFNLENFQWTDREIVPAEVKTEGLNRFQSAAQGVGEAGVAISLNRIDRRVSALYGSDLFEGVGYRLKKDGGRTLLTYEFQESPPTTVGVGLRYDRDYDFTASLDLISRDFLRSGSDLTFRGLAGSARSAELGWNYPTIAANRLFFSPRIYFRSYPRFIFNGDEIAGEFSDERTGVDLGFRYLLGNRGRLEGGYLLDRVNIARGAGMFSQAEPEKVGLLRAGLRLDTLDDFGFPTAGWRGRILVERADSALGGDSDFTRFSAKVDRYFALGDRDAVGLKGFWGLIRGQAPFYERFYAGGAHYLSFSAETFVGLRRDERVSDHLLTAGLSYRREIKQFQLGFLKAVYLEAEYQAGLFNRDRRLLDFEPALHGFGGGLHLDTRFFGPISLTLGGTNQSDFNAYVSFGRFF